MAKHSIRVQFADMTIHFESELESDIDVLCDYFKYHLVDSSREANCTVVLKRRSSFRMPKDAKMQWQSKKNTVIESEECTGRRRVRTLNDLDAFGLASCYVSQQRGEYYYGLMQDRSWICCRPSERIINYVLHQSPQQEDCLVGNEGADPVSALPLLMHVISTIFGRFLIHGAAVSIDNRAFLFLGKSGSGKSTLSTDLARKGLSFMGDDIVLLYMKDGIPMIGSLLFQAKLHIGNAKEKEDIDVIEEMNASYCLSAPLESVYLVRQSGMPVSTVEARPSVELLQQLMEASNGMMMQYDKNKWLTTMYNVSESVPFSIFNFGDRSSLDISLLKNS